jgi:cytochrome c oxidase cbb3-type subunit I/II
MPAYPWLYDDKVEAGVLADKMRVLKKLGTPYTDVQLQNAVADYRKQADEVVATLASQGKTGADPETEIVALIGYLMRLGRNLEPANGKSASIEGGK